jgi:hypothetical protein
VAEKPRNKIYWNEGVTRKEVETALSANKHPALYRRSARRSLVGIYAVLIMLLILSSAIAAVKLASYISAISGALLIAVYFALRYSVRLIGDAPTELLDERLVAIRDRTYLMAYRWLSFVIGIIFGFAIAGDFSFARDSWWPIVIALGMLIAGLPSMILAWTLPSEEPQL